VITSDIAVDPLWIGYRERALSNGLRAAWSEPLLSKDHQMLGTFAIFCREPRTPSESDLRLIEGAGHVAVIAIEGERARAALAEATERNSENLRLNCGIHGSDERRGDGGGLSCTRFSSRRR
jgi:GAF domain-containing protein